MKDDFENLLKLLDDDNEQLVSIAMAELLKRSGDRLNELLRSLQESPDMKFRRRIHQLQNAIESRRRRSFIAEKFRSDDLSLTDGMIYLHLLWFDNDTLEEMTEQWNQFLESFRKLREPKTLPRLLKCLSGEITIYTDPGDPENPEVLCVGTVLESGIATDYMGCIIARLLAAYWGFETDVISHQGDFFIHYQGSVYAPRTGWSPLPQADLQQKTFRRWKDAELISLFSYSLFTDAVATDSFRYIHTLGSCIGQRENPDFLPYPYGNDTLDQSSPGEE